MAMKYKLLAELLRENLLQNGEKAGYKFPTEAELCQRYHMSRQTVRHALQLLAEQGLVEKRHGSGTYSTGKAAGDTHQIAVLATFPDDYIFPVILRDVQDVLAGCGYSTTVYATENHVSTEREILQKLLEQSFSGLLVEGTKTALPNPNAGLYQQLQSEQVPIVFLHGCYTELNGVPCVLDDNYGGGYQLANYLISKGHHQIGGIFKSDDVQGLQRYHGTISAIRDAGLPIYDSAFSWYDTQARYEMMKQHNIQFLQNYILNRLQEATAVVCYNDEIACLLIRELQNMGRRVPNDVAVVSFDNSFYCHLGSIHITSLRHKNSRMGRTAAEMLVQLIRNGRTSSRTLSWELVPRSSS